MTINNDVRMITLNPRHISDVSVKETKNIEKNFANVLFELIDEANLKNVKATELQKLATISPEEINVHDVIIAEEEARITLLFAKTVIDKAITSWKDLLNLR